MSDCTQQEPWSLGHSHQDGPLWLLNIMIPLLNEKWFVHVSSCRLSHKLIFWVSMSLSANAQLRRSITMWSIHYDGGLMNAIAPCWTWTSWISNELGSDISWRISLSSCGGIPMLMSQLIRIMISWDPFTCFLCVISMHSFSILRLLENAVHSLIFGGDFGLWDSVDRGYG